MDSASSLLLKLRVQIRVYALESNDSARSLSFSSGKSQYQTNSQESTCSFLHHSCQERAAFYSPPLSAATSPNASFLMSSHSMDEFVPRYHSTRLSYQFLLLVAATAKLSLVKNLITEKYQKLYPHEIPLKIQCLRDKNDCDLDDDYMVMEIFNSYDTIKVIRWQEETDAKKPKEEYKLCSAPDTLQTLTGSTLSNQELTRTERTEQTASSRKDQHSDHDELDHDSKSFLSSSVISVHSDHDHDDDDDDVNDDDVIHLQESFQTAPVEPESENESISYKSSSTEQEDNESDSDSEDEKLVVGMREEEERKADDSISMLKRKFESESESENESEDEYASNDLDHGDAIKNSDSDRFEIESEPEPKFELDSEPEPESSLGKDTKQTPLFVTHDHTLSLKENPAMTSELLNRKSTVNPFLSSPLNHGDKVDKHIVKSTKDETLAIHRLMKKEKKALEDENSSSDSSSTSSSDDESSSHRSLSYLPSLKSMKINRPSAPPPVVVMQKSNVTNIQSNTAKKPPIKKAYSAAIFSSN